MEEGFEAGSHNGFIAGRTRFWESSEGKHMADVTNICCSHQKISWYVGMIADREQSEL
jgi:hypothetical protein